MARRCPSCRWVDPVGREAWARWACVGCGALLGHSKAWLFAALAVFLAGLAGYALSREFGLRWVGWAAQLTMTAGVVLSLVSRRIVLLSRGPHCRQCLYDLSALDRDARCPECGAGRGVFIRG